MSELIIDYDLSVQPAIDRDMRIRDTAPEMLELLGKIRNHIDGTCRECESKAIVPEIDALLDKIEGGGNET